MCHSSSCTVGTLEHGHSAGIIVQYSTVEQRRVRIRSPFLLFSPTIFLFSENLSLEMWERVERERKRAKRRHQCAFLWRWKRGRKREMRPEMRLLFFLFSLFLEEGATTRGESNNNGNTRRTKWNVYLLMLHTTVLHFPQLITNTYWHRLQPERPFHLSLIPIHLLLLLLLPPLFPNILQVFQKECRWQAFPHLFGKRKE